MTIKFIRFIFFQSTLLQEERHVGGTVSIVNVDLSIHAPTRGATFLPHIGQRNNPLFQSTLLQEERLCWEIILTSDQTFNPRSYKRSDKILPKYTDLYKLSIHAPTRGATISPIKPDLFSGAFNPRSYKRSDKEVLKKAHLGYDFQSTLLQEERHRNTSHFMRNIHFQSTLLQEERLLSVLH